MQDFKNLSGNKKHIGHNRSSNDTDHRIIKADTRHHLRIDQPHGRRRERLKHVLLFLAIVIGLTPVFVLVFQHAPAVVRNVTAWVGARTLAKPAPATPQPSGFRVATSLLDTAQPDNGRLQARTPAGDTVYYTLRPDLQQKMHEYLARYKVPYGAVVALEPSTGRILAMTSYSAVDRNWESNACFELYPMASLFKIITASAALEARKMTPETLVSFRGNAHSENPKYWDVSPRGRNNKTDVTLAMAKSINPVYGRVASDLAGKESVMQSVRKFGFNQTLLPGVPVKESRATDPQSNHALMRMGAGLDHEVKISPLHAAAIMAAIGNQGRMMTPILAEKVVDAKGAVKETPAPTEIRQLVSAETAASLGRMLSTTVTSGTSRRAFHDRRGRPILKIDIAAKTGSINGNDPKGQYSWFAGYAPLKNPRIAVVALVVNQDKWRVKASQVGAQAMEEFFSR